MEFGVRANVNIFFYFQLVSKQLVNNPALDTDITCFICMHICICSKNYSCTEATFTF